jgi:hypothetical protein
MPTLRGVATYGSGCVGSLPAFAERSCLEAGGGSRQQTGGGEAEAGGGEEAESVRLAEQHGQKS